MSLHAVTMPSNAVDSHCHVFDPERFPYSKTRRYTPPSATVEDLLRFRRSINVSRTVLVQPSVYGTDNRCLLDALSRIGSTARGIAVIGEACSAKELDELVDAGVVGVRINLEIGKEASVEHAVMHLEKTVNVLAGRPLIIQINAALAVIESMAGHLLRQPHRIILDHFGQAKALNGPHQAGMSTLKALMASGKIFVKLSGPYQISRLKPSYSDTIDIAEALVHAAPKQVIWGSDWPHTGGSERASNVTSTDVEPFRVEDESRNLELLRSWAKDKCDRDHLLAGNATSLFRFPDA